MHQIAQILDFKIFRGGGHAPEPLWYWVDFAIAFIHSNFVNLVLKRQTEKFNGTSIF